MSNRPLEDIQYDIDCQEDKVYDLEEDLDNAKDKLDRLWDEYYETEAQRKEELDSDEDNDDDDDEEPEIVKNRQR